MPETMLTMKNQRALLETIRETMDMALGPDGDRVHEELLKFNKRSACWQDEQLAPTPTLKAMCAAPTQESASFGSFSTITVPARETPLRPRECFVVNKSPQALIRIKTIMPGFVQLCMSRAEESVGEQRLCFGDLLREASPSEIEKSVGAPYLYTNLTAYEYLLIKQGKGEGGVLKNGGIHNAFFLPRSKMIPPTIALAWWAHDEGWVLHAINATHQTKQMARFRVFTRDPDPSPSIDSVLEQEHIA